MKTFTSGEEFDHLRGELWTDAGVLVLEINVCVLPIGLFSPNEFGPARDIIARVIFAPQPQIAVVSRDRGGGGLFFSIGEAKRNLAFAKQPENFVVEPGF